MFSQQLKSDLFALSEHNVTKFIIFFLVVFSQVFHYQFWFNEYDVLPTIYSQTDPNWLAHDWYLSLDIGYRFIFNNLTGPIANLLGFQYGSYTIRIVLYVLFIAAYIRFVNTIKLGLFFSTITLFLFTYYQSLAFGEWMVGGVETKTVAYAFVLLSISYMTENKYRLALAFSGVAVSFHILIGIYNALALFILFLAFPEHRQRFWHILKNIWLFILLAANGLFFLFQQLIGDGSEQVRENIWNYYIQFRVPHHTLPEYWLNSVNTWILYLSLATIVPSLVLRVPREVKQFTTVYTACYLQILLGFAVYEFADISLMRLFFFRFADTMIPLLSFVLSAFYLKYVLSLISDGFLKRATAGLLGTPIICLLVLYTSYKKYHDMRWHQNERYNGSLQSRMSLFEGIRTQTDTGDTFLVPLDFDDFYIFADRSPFVTFKHLPQSAGNLNIWVDRIEYIYGVVDPNDYQGFKSLEKFNELHYSVTEADLRRAKAKFEELDYFVTIKSHQLDLPVALSNEAFIVYEIN